MRALDVTSELVELWQQGSTGDSLRASGRVRKPKFASEQDALNELVRQEFRRQLVRYLRKRINQRKQAALKPSLVNRFVSWAKAKFVKPARPTPHPLIVAHDEMVANAQLSRQAQRAIEIHRANCSRGGRKGVAGQRSRNLRRLLENPNLLRIVQTIEYERVYFDRLMRQAPGR